MSAMRTLIVLRHAKAVQQPGLADLERPLTGRGRRDARAAGAWLQAEGLVPDLVLCSPSRRTRETWEGVGATLGPVAATAEISYDERLYDAGAGGLLDIVREAPGDVGVLLTVGHNPASGQLVADLTGERGLPFPTAAIGVATFSGEWADAATAGCLLARSWTPHPAS